GRTLPKRWAIDRPNGASPRRPPEADPASRPATWPGHTSDRRRGRIDLSTHGAPEFTPWMRAQGESDVVARKPPDGCRACALGFPGAMPGAAPAAIARAGRAEHPDPLDGGPGGVPCLGAVGAPA